MNQEIIEKVLLRNEQPLEFKSELGDLQKINARVLITGANGSLGKLVSQILNTSRISHLATDIDECDVTDISQVNRVVNDFLPTHILHLAADKHAPEGETDPANTFSINVQGTLNIIGAASQIGAKVVLASTCKSCDPETVYGSSKLIAERITLNSSGAVARFFNVVDTSGNVFEIWDKQLAQSEQIQVAGCTRYFISSSEAVSLLIKCLGLVDKKPGRYSFDPGTPHFMPDIAKRLFPLITVGNMPPRRGDRLVEPLKATSERITSMEGRLIHIHSPHDPI